MQEDSLFLRAGTPTVPMLPPCPAQCLLANAAFMMENANPNVKIGPAQNAQSCQPAMWSGALNAMQQTPASACLAMLAKD